MISYSRLKLSDLYTLSQSELLENHTLHSGTYIYSPYMTVPPPPHPAGVLVRVITDLSSKVGIVTNLDIWNLRVVLTYDLEN